MSEAVNRCYEAVFWFGGGITADEGVEDVVVGIGEEDRFDICVVHADMFHSVFFLVATGELVLLDSAVHIVIDKCSNDESVLCLPVHGLSVDVVLFLGVLYQPSLVLELLDSNQA